MQIREERHGDNLVVALAGRLDLITSPTVEAQLLATVAGVKTLVFDTTDLGYVSSAGLRVLMVVAKAVRANGGDAFFTGVGPNVLKILEISGFTKMFKIVDSARDAFAAS